MKPFAYVVVPAQAEPRIVETDDLYISLEESQKITDGYIEIVKSQVISDLWMIIDDSGKLADKPINFYASALYGVINDYIAGDCIVCGQGFNKDGEPDVIPLPRSRADRVYTRALAVYKWGV